jgi:DNA-binding transcriptional regulator LsrR (DeoR family)
MEASSDPRLLVKIGKLYFEEGLTQQEIADNLRISRSTVSRLLARARDEHLIQISVKVPPGIYPELERTLERRFELVEAIVAEAPDYDSPSTVYRELGRAAAGYLQRTVRTGDVIGFAWGQTMKEMVNDTPRRTIPGVTVVQLNGGLTPQITDLHATALTRELAARLGADCFILQAPGVVDSPETQQILMTDAQVREVFDLASRANIAFVGIGAVSADALWGRAGLLTEKVTAELRSLGAVGDIMSRYFDSEGVLVSSSLCRRVVGLPIPQLLRIGRRVGVAGGRDKLEAILGALRGSYVNVLITDHVTATELAERPKFGPTGVGQ